MMATILNSSILNSAILHKTLIQANSIWHKLIHSESNLLMAVILNSAILDSAILHKKNFIHSHSTWWYQPSWIVPCWIQTLPSWIQTPCYLLSDSLKNTLTPLWLCLKLIQSDKLNDGNHLEFFHLEFCHLGFRHLAIFSQDSLKNSQLWLCLKLIHSDSTWWWQVILNSAILDSAILHKTKNSTSLIHSDSTWWWQPSWTLPSWIQPFCTKRTSLIHSDSTWWWQPSWILPCWIQTLPSWIQTPCYLLSDSLKNTLTPLWLWLKLIQSVSN